MIRSIGKIIMTGNFGLFRWVIRLCLFSIILLSNTSSLAVANSSSEKNILVLHSYHHGLSWTDAISEGIQSVLSDGTKYNVVFEYLDAKRNFSEAYFNKLSAAYKEKSFPLRYDIIIVTDNAALNFVREYGGTLFNNVPIVFCGINNFSEKLVAGLDDIHGVAERADHSANIRLIRSLHPDVNKIFIIGDETLTGKNIHQELIRDLQEFPDLNMEYVSSYTIPEIQDKIRQLDLKDVIYLLVINRDRKGNFIQSRDGIRYIKDVSQVPVYGGWDFYMGKGVVGGKLTSAYQQGKKAAQIAVDVLSGNPPSNLVDWESGNRYMFDIRELRKLRIRPSRLPENSEIYFKRAPFYETYATELLIFLQFLVTYLAIFTYLKVRQSRMLSNMVKVKTLELRNANEKLHALSITDDLTGLYNRRYLLMRLQEYCTKADRYGEDVTLFMFDIDNFKNINDEIGHPGGDEVLSAAGELIKNNLRASDVAARYGGDEFVVIFPSCDIDTAGATALKLGELINQLTVEGLNIPVTISGGLCQIKENDFREALQCVDNKLYEAKQLGRNRICTD